MGLQPDQDLLAQLKAQINEPLKEAFWHECANEVVDYLQTEIEAGYQGEETLNQLHLIGKILLNYRQHVNETKLKGILLDRIFNLLRDGEIHRVPTRTFSEILTSVR